MSIVFVTKWSDYFMAPLVEVFAHGQHEKIASAIPLNKKMDVEDENGKVITDDATRRVGYATIVSTALKEEKNNLSPTEVDVIVEFLLQSENFTAFESLMTY